MSWLRSLAVVAAVGVFAIATDARAGGEFSLKDGSSGYCRFVHEAHYLMSIEDRSVLREEVDRRYFHAVEVSNAPSTYASTTPLFVWAHEAKVSCAKVIGYLKKPIKWWKAPDLEKVQRCECFYARMLTYLGRHPNYYGK